MKSELEVHKKARRVTFKHYLKHYLKHLVCSQKNPLLIINKMRLTIISWYLYSQGSNEKKKEKIIKSSIQLLKLFLILSKTNNVFPNPGHCAFIRMKQFPRIILAMEADPQREEEKWILKFLLSTLLDCETDFLLQ